MRSGFWVLILLLANLVSALTVIRSKQETRHLENELQQQRLAQDRLDSEWSQLRLEEAVWSGLGRIEKVARDKLGMQPPRSYHIVPGIAAPNTPEPRP